MNSRQPFLERNRRIGIGIDEDVAVVEGGDQPGESGQQHAVAEHVAGHVADPDRGEGFGLDVDAELRGTAASTDSQAPRAVIPIALWS